MGQPVCPGNRSLRRRTAAALGLTLAVGALVSGCGGGEKQAGAATPTDRVNWTLVLDFQPNAVHAGLVHAQRAGYFRKAGISLRIVAPSSTSDSLTQVARGRAQLGLADLIDVARRNERPTADAAAVQPVAGIVQEPLGGILVARKSGITEATQLAGRSIAVTGLPSDIAVAQAILGADGTARSFKPVELGFDGLKALDAGRVDGATAYWPADQVTMAQLGTPARAFTLSGDGNVHYPGLVAFASHAVAKEHPAAVRAFAAALRRGTQEVIADPAVGDRALAAEYPELDRKATAAQLKNYQPLFGTAQTAGQLTDESLTAFSSFAAKFKLTSRLLSPTELRGGAAG